MIEVGIGSVDVSRSYNFLAFNKEAMHFSSLKDFTC